LSGLGYGHGRMGPTIEMPVVQLCRSRGVADVAAVAGVAVAEEEEEEEEVVVVVVTAMGVVMEVKVPIHR